MRRPFVAVWTLVRRQPGRTVVCIAGLGVTAASFVTPDGGDPFAILALCLGVGMVTLSGLVPWLKKVSVSPHGGFVAETRDPAEITTGLAEEGPAEFVRGTITVMAADDEASTVSAILDEDEVLDAARWVVAEAAVSKLLRPEEGALANCDLHLYLYDADEKKLLPVFEPDDDEPSEGWEPGKGATGAAYARSEFVVVTGEHTHDEAYGLSEDQRRKYRELTAVAAMPVMNASDQVIAVLSASTTGQEHCLDTPDGFDELLMTATAVGRILVELLGWEED